MSRWPGILVLFALVLVRPLWAEDPVPVSLTCSGVPVTLVAVPPGWASALVPAAGRERALLGRDLVLVNGGYFDGGGRPDALVISGPERSGPLRRDPPYSGFLWCDAGGALHITPGNEPPEQPRWAIQSGPLLVEAGQAAIRRSTAWAHRSVIALRQGRTLVIRSGSLGLKELAEWLVAMGVDTAINLDGGPSSALRVQCGGRTWDLPGSATVPYSLGFTPGGP